MKTPAIVVAKEKKQAALVEQTSEGSDGGKEAGGDVLLVGDVRGLLRRVEGVYRDKGERRMFPTPPQLALEPHCGEAARACASFVDEIDVDIR